MSGVVQITFAYMNWRCSATGQVPLFVVYLVT